MAIQLCVTTVHGIDLPNAYIKINQFVGDAKYVSYTVRTYADDAARQADKQPLDEKNYSFENDQSKGNIMTECYCDLMSRPEYAGCVKA